MSRRNAFMLFFITILSGELTVTGLSLVFDSVLLWWLSQPVVIVAALFVVGLLGASKDRATEDDATNW